MVFRLFIPAMDLLVPAAMIPVGHTSASAHFSVAKRRR